MIQFSPFLFALRIVCLQILHQLEEKFIRVTKTKNSKKQKIHEVLLTRCDLFKIIFYISRIIQELSAREEAAQNRRNEIEAARIAKTNELRLRREEKEARIAQQKVAKVEQAVC